MTALAMQTWDPIRQIVPEFDPTFTGDDAPTVNIAEPERRLLFAVLVDAILRARRLSEAPRTAARHELLEAERWIRSEDRSWPCSFVNVCEALGLAHEPLRRAVLSWRRQGPSTRKRVTRRGLLVKRNAGVALDPEV